MTCGHCGERNVSIGHVKMCAHMEAAIRGIGASEDHALTGDWWRETGWTGR